MSDWKILPIEKDKNGNKIKIHVLYEGLKLSYIPIITIKNGKESKEIEESSRVYIYGEEYTPEKVKIHKSIEEKIREVVWNIFYKKNKEIPVNKFFIPNEAKITEEADQIYSEINALLELNPEKSSTEILVNTLKSKALPMQVSFLGARHLTYDQKKIIFNIYKVGLRISPEGWIIITKKDGNTILRNVVFNIDLALRMQDHILDSYLRDANNILGEIPRVGELIELTRKINNLLVDWENSQKHKNNLKSKINSLIKDLSEYRNKLKLEAREILESFANLTDSRGRENPSAFAAKTVAMLNRLEDRLEQIRKITPVIEKRKKVLNDTKDFLEKEKRRAENELTKFLNIRNFSYYTAGGINEIRINKIIHIVDALNIEPFASKRMQAVFFLQEAKNCIWKTKIARKYLQDALAILQS